MAIQKISKIFVAGHKGLVGSAVVRRLVSKGYKRVLTKDKNVLDLTNQFQVFRYLKKEKPDAVIICAAKVGGIMANNKYKANFIYDNLAIQSNLIHGSYLNNVKKLIFLGSSCVYPRNSRQPIKESDLLSGFLEPTNEPYAIAKISGIKLCQSYNFQYGLDYKSLMPTNTFGPNDNYDLNNCHFLPALIKKIHLAKTRNKKFIELWGNGVVKRELIFVDDLADAIVYFLKKKTKETLINIGSGIEKTIEQYARELFKIIGYYPKIKYKNLNLSGTPRKLLNTSLSKKYGWQAKTELKLALEKTYQDFLIKGKL